MHRVLQDQLERASPSVVLNIAEGAGRRSHQDKPRFHAMSRGSGMGTAGVIDALWTVRLAPEGASRRARLLAVLVVQLLTKPDEALA